MLSRLWSFFGALLRRRRMEQDMESEMEFHIGQYAADLEKQGHSATEARRMARAEFGSVPAAQEACREARALRWIDELQQDLRYGWRSLRGSLTFTLAAAGTLAIGAGAVTALFSIVDSVLFRPLPYREPERLAQVGWYYPKGALLVLKERSKSFESLAAYQANEFNLADAGRPERVRGSFVTADFFRVLGATPQLGRTFDAEEDLAGRDDVAILSDSLWRRRFGASPSVIGRRTMIEGAPHTVIGVMPREFRFPGAETQVWLPARMTARQSVEMWGTTGFLIVGRLRQGVSEREATAELKLLSPQIRASFPWRMPDIWGATPEYAVTPLQQALTGSVRTRLLLLLASAALVMMIACANVANLLFVRGAARQREIAIRGALGGGRARLARQLLTESLLLSLLGGGAGAALAYASLPVLQRTLPANLPQFSNAAIDGRVLAFALILALGTGLLFGLAPAWRGSASELMTALRASDTKATGDPRRRRLASALVVCEVALAVVLSMNAGLLIRSLRQMLSVAPGFRTEHVVSVRVTPNRDACRQASRCVALYQEVIERFRQLPGVVGAAATSDLPLTWNSSMFAIELEGHPLPPGAPANTAYHHVITPGYFDAMGIPIERGHDFTEHDAATSAMRVIVSASLAQRFWPNENPVGKKLRYVWQKEWREVVGVVGSVRQEGLAAAPVDEFYLPIGPAEPPAAADIVVRTSGDPIATGAALARIVEGVDPDTPVSAPRTMDEIVTSSVATPRSTMSLLSGFAAVALLLGAIGIYGLVSYTVQQRTQEIGIRVALGASAGEITRLIAWEGMWLAVLGVGVGLGLSVASARLLRTMLYAVDASDPATLAATASLLLIVALVACALPIRRALRLDPSTALRTA